MRRSSRLFAIAEALRARRTGITAEALAERFGVSLRTIYRDLDSLRDADLPLSAERGRGGGYALDRNYGLPPVNFNVREAMLLIVLGRMAEHLRFLPFTTRLRSAVDKVRGALPVALQRRLEALDARVAFTGVPAHAAIAPIHDVIEDALFDEQWIDITYLRKNGTVGSRRVRIKQVVFERSETLFNFEDVSGERRQIRLHQLLSAVPYRSLDDAKQP